MKRVASIVLVAIGSVTLATLVLLMLAQVGLGHVVGFLPGNACVFLAGATVVCFSLGAFLWKGWPVTFGEVWVLTGSFLLGVATRSGPAEAELLGVFGLLSFSAGYLVLKRATDRNHTLDKASPQDREKALERMLEDSGSPTQRVEAENEFPFLRGLSAERS